MTTQYTSILKLALPVQGELSGSWGDVVNDNITEMVEQAVAGLATINSWTANSHTLTSADGTTSESRCAVLVADDDGAGNPSGAATIICPAASKLYVLKNISGQEVTLKTSAGTGVAVPNGSTAFLFCDGTNVEACQTTADINSGTIDGTTIGGSSAAAGTFTTFTSTGIDDNATSTALTISSADNVGVGTATPDRLFEVEEASGDAYIRLRASDTGGGADTIFENLVADNGQNNYIFFGDLDDVDIGIIRYSHASDFMSFTTNASERMRIDSSGNVGIGISSPATKFHVLDGSSSLRFRQNGTVAETLTIGPSGGDAAIYLGDAADTVRAGLYYDTSENDLQIRGYNNSTRIIIDSSGNVGIGTLAPSTKLEISTNSETSVLRLTDTATIGAVDRKVGGVEFYQNDASGGAGIGSSIEAYHVNVSGDTDLRFATGDNSEAMRIDSSGNVGIGVSTIDTALGTKLHVAGTIRTDTGSANANPAIVFDHDNFADADANYIMLDRASEAMRFNVNASERIRVTSSGNVGIGTSSPNEILTVQRNGTAVAGLSPSTVASFQSTSATAQSSYLSIIAGSSGSTGQAALFFGDADDPDIGKVLYRNSDDSMDFVVNAASRMKIAADGTTAVTPTSAGATQGLAVYGSGMANGSNMVFISMGTNTGNFISGNNSSGQQFAISHAGALSKTSGSFKIDHPLPSKNATHCLVHSFIEGPKADLIYRGSVDLVSGMATVNIDTVSGMTDGTFVALCTDVQCFTSNEDGWTALKGSVTGNVLTITAQDDSCTDTVGWMVIGERCDPHMLETEWTDAAGKVIVEPLKPEHE